MTGVESLHGERAAGEVDGAVEGRVVVGIPRTAGVEVEGLVRGVGVVGKGASDVESAGGEGGELSGVEGLDVEGATGEVDGAVEGRVVAGIPGTAGVEVEGLVGGAGVVGECAGHGQGAAGEREVAGGEVEVGDVGRAPVERGGGGERAAAGEIDRPAGGDIRCVGEGSGHAEGSGGESQVGGVVGPRHGKGPTVERGDAGQGVIVRHERAAGDGGAAGVGIGA